MITVQDLSKSYHIGNTELCVLRGVNLRIETGEIVAIMGSSGSGKSTLLNILGMLDAFDSGEYTLDDLQVKNFSETLRARYRNRYIGFVFQSFNLLAFKTALENVALPLQMQGVRRTDRMERAREALASVQLADRLEHFPSELSGGENQRVAIARAIVTEPSVILADEPTGALDSDTSRQIMGILQGLNARGKTILVVTHEDFIAAATHRIIRIRDGKIESEGAHDSVPSCGMPAPS